jgi:hypothetical protein
MMSAMDRKQVGIYLVDLHPALPAGTDAVTGRLDDQMRQASRLEDRSTRRNLYRNGTGEKGNDRHVTPHLSPCG